MSARHKVRRPLRAVVAAIAALAAGAVLATGVVAPALADTKMDFTVKVASQKGTALKGVTVEAIPMQDGLPVETDLTWPLVAKAVSGHTGWYKFTGTQQLTMGTTYTLLFAPSGSIANSTFTQLLGGVQEWAQAETFIPGTSFTSVNTTLRVNGVLAGKVTTPSNKAVSGAVVYAYEYDGSAWQEVAHAKTNSSGKYSIHNLEPGSYRLEFDKANAYPTAYSGGSTTLDGAIAYDVGLGRVVTANARFSTGGTISGKVYWYDEDSGYSFWIDQITPIAYPLVGTPGNYTAVDMSSPSYGTRSSRSGTWSVKGLLTGAYAIFFDSPWVNIASGYASGGSVLTDWPSWDGDRAAYTVVAGKTTKIPLSQLVDLDYAHHGATFTVHAPDGSGAAGVNVYVQHPTIADRYYNLTTNSQGVAAINPNYGIPSGDYLVTITDPSGRFEPFSGEAQISSTSHSFVFQLGAAIPIVFTTPPTLDTTDPTMGTTYTVTETTNRPTNLEYQWFRDDDGDGPHSRSMIYGAVGASYTSVGSDAGSVLSVRVTAWLGGLFPVSADATVGQVSEGAAPTVITAPSVRFDGPDAHVDSVLHANLGVWSVPGVHASYQWLRDGLPIPDTTSSYTVTLDDYTGSHALSVQVVVGRVGYADSAPVTTDPVTLGIAPPAVPAATFVVSTSTKGVPKGARKYTVKPGAWSTTGLSFAYSWSIEGDPVPAASPSTTVSYVSTKADPPGPLAVTITATKPGYQDAVVTQVVRAATQRLVSATPPVVQDARLGDVLTSDTPVGVDDRLSVANGGVWQIPIGAHVGAPVPPDSYAYQWYRQTGSAAPVAIAGATQATYAVTLASSGMRLSVKVTALSHSWASASVTVPAGQVGLNTALQDAPPTVSTSGTLVVGSSVSSTVGAWPVAGVSQAYQWYRCAAGTCPDPFDPAGLTAIAGATAAQYTLTSLDRGAELYVVVTGTLPGYEPATAASAAIPVPMDGELDVVTPPAIPVDASGAAEVGQRTDVQPGVFSVGSVSHTYDWEICDPDAPADCTDETAWHLVEVSPTYYPTAADYGTGDTLLRVSDTASLSGYLPVTAMSATVLLAPGLPPLPTPSYASAPSTGTPSCTVYPTAGAAFGVGEPVTTWYSGTAEIGTGVHFEGSNPDVDEPLYALVVYPHLPGSAFTDRTFALPCAATAHQPAHEEVTIIGSSFGSPLTLSTTDPMDVLPVLRSYTTVGINWYGANNSYQGGAVYTPTPADVGHKIRLNLYFRNPFYKNIDTLIDEYSDVIQPLTLSVASDPTVVPATAVREGTMLTATPPGFDTSGVTLVYSWETSSDGVTWAAIPGATAVSLAVPNAADGDQLRFTAAATKPGYAALSLSSDPLTVEVPGVLSGAGQPAIGAAQVGVPMVADPGTWINGAVVTYQWTRDGTPVPGATSVAYTPDATAAGDELAFVVTARRPGYATVVAESNAAKVALGVAPVAKTKPKISKSNATLSVTTGVWNVSGLVFSYQWYDGDTQIPDATQSSYTLAGGQIAANIHVTVTATAIGYQPGSVTIP